MIDILPYIIILLWSQYFSLFIILLMDKDFYKSKEQYYKFMIPFASIYYMFKIIFKK